MSTCNRRKKYSYRNSFTYGRPCQGKVNFTQIQPIKSLHGSRAIAAGTCLLCGELKKDIIMLTNSLTDG